MQKNYPRPQLCRENWKDLNGKWRFLFDDEDRGESRCWYKDVFSDYREIIVPFSYETRASGIGDGRLHRIVWYQRDVEWEPSGKRTLLHFEGVDYVAKVWVNGRCAGSHTGGYARFSMDITPYLTPGTNTLTVRAQDSDSCVQPRGKQRWKRENFGCWYVQTTGIWKTVWMEEVPEHYIQTIKVTPDIDRARAVFSLTLNQKPEEPLELECRILYQGSCVSGQRINVSGQSVAFEQPVCNPEEPWQVEYWSPGHPALYDVELTLEDGGQQDRADSYFGMRKISAEGGKVLLNNRPFYQRLILDQGYWKESGLTPPSEEALIRDIDLILQAGYNGLRKHEKIEDERFLYWCDVKGLVVWCEMPSQYTFHDRAMEAYVGQWMEIVRQNYNHPCIITWTAFNESWGIEHVYTDEAQQKFTEAVYHLTKAFDAMRPVIVNDGWEHTVSDILTLHDYEEDARAFRARYGDMQALVENRIPFNKERYALARGFVYRGQPVLLSEYGGIAFSTEEGWGYGRQADSEEAFLKRFGEMMEAIRDTPYFTGFCYTQLTDVEQEVNGLCTMEREPKVDMDEIKKINML